MALSVLFKATRAKIGVVELDASISETHTKRVEATTHPVERGAKITDHLRPEPSEIVIEGLVSNTPVGRGAAVRAVEFAGTGNMFMSAGVEASFATPGYAEEAFAKLRDIAERGELVTVVTSLTTYTDMAIVSLDVPRDRSTGDAIRFSCTLRQIVLVENKVTAVRPQTDPRANKKAKLGRRQKKQIDQAVKLGRKVTAPFKGVVEEGSTALRGFRNTLAAVF